MPLLQPLALPCGVMLKNRIVKAAITERLAGPAHVPNELHHQLYRTWASNGSGLLISGNIMVDGRFLESGGNLVLEEGQSLKPFQEWTQRVQSQGTPLWAQINHPGRQATVFSTLQPWAPSAVKLKKLGLFARPKEMTDAEIREVVARFAHTAALCREVGFSGVQIHAAHGYLISQWLSPHTNRRQDDWGGDKEKRSRFLLEIVRAVKASVGDDFPVSVKINSADFQRGGFTEAEAVWVINQLNQTAIDLLEVSGGTYEEIVFLSKASRRASSIEREGYFLQFARQIRSECRLPLMVTGGFRSLDFCNQVLALDELDLIGFARPYLLEPDFPQGWLTGACPTIKEPDLSVSWKPLQGMEEGAWYDYQVKRLAQGLDPDLHYHPMKSVVRLTLGEAKKGMINRLTQWRS